MLDELNYYVQPSLEDLPRVWWIGTGLATSFPFYSAGDISAGPTESAYYQVILSYTPTIKALQHTQERSGPTILSCRNPYRAVIITMPKTPGAGNLPGMTTEKSEVMAAMRSSILIQVLEQPDTASAMVQL